MSCTGVVFGDLCQKVQMIQFGRLLLRNVRFWLPRQAIYLGQDHYNIAFADFDEIPGNFREFRKSKKRKVQMSFPRPPRSIFREIFQRNNILEIFLRFSSKSPTRFSSGVAPRISLTFLSKTGKWRKCANFPKISDISATFRRSLRRSRNFAHISCENSSSGHL